MTTLQVIETPVIIPSRTVMPISSLACTSRIKTSGFKWGNITKIHGNSDCGPSSLSWTVAKAVAESGARDVRRQDESIEGEPKVYSYL